MARDRGLQAERTSLAWTRMALAGSTCGALILLRDRHAADVLHNPARIIIGCTVIAVAATAYGLGVRRRRELTLWGPTPPARARRSVIGVGVAVVVLTVLVTAYTLVTPR